MRVLFKGALLAVAAATTATAAAQIDEALPLSEAGPPAIESAEQGSVPAETAVGVDVANEVPTAQASADAAGSEAPLDTVPVEPVAEAQSDEPASRRSASRVIEEIVVTAQKREENLQDVPISVSAFSGDKLEALGIGDPKDLANVTPGLTYSSLVGYSIIYIRGVGTDVFLPSADTSVATYIDGVYFPFAHSLASSFTKLERIEILKGPQGTLFGRNSTGGAINIVSKKPGDEFEASGDVTFGNFNAKNAKVFVSGPLFDSVSASIAAVYDDKDIYHDFAPDSPVQSLPSDRTVGFNPRIRWDPTDDITAIVSGYVTRFRGVGSVISTIQDPTPLGQLIGNRELDEPYQVSLNNADSLKADNDVAYGTLEWRPEPVDIKLLASHQKVVTDTLFDYDAGPANGAYFEPTNQFLTATTAELQFSSKTDGFLTFSNSFQWTAGYYFFKSLGGFDPVYFGILEPDSPTSPISIAQILGQGLGLLQDLGLPVPRNVELELRGTVDTLAHAVYAQGTWSPTDWLGITLGARFQTEDRGIVKASSGISRRPVAEQIVLLDFPKESVTTENFSPKLTFDFRPFDDGTLLYVSGQRGYKSGTYNVVTIYTPPTYVKPEEVTAYEAGIKGNLGGGTFQYNAALFRNEIKDLQTLVVSLTSGGAVQLANAAKATIQGVDFDLTWQALPDLLPGFVVTASGAYQDATYNDFPNAPGFDPVTGLYFGPGALIPSAEQNFAGNIPVRTPEYTATLGLNQAFELKDGVLELGVNGTYNSGYFYDTQNTATQPEHTILNARASYLYEPWQVRVTVFGKNLTEEVYFLNKFANDFGTNTTFAPPREYGLTLGWEF